MSTGQEVRQLLAEWEKKRTELLERLGEITPEDLNAQDERGRSVRELMHHIVDHDKDSRQHLMAMRTSIGSGQDAVNRLLEQMKMSQGELAANLVGLEDGDLDKEVEGDEWTIRQLIDHVTRVDDFFLGGINQALEG